MMQIGSVKISNEMVFAPLAGITNLPMRMIAKEKGCGLVCSEMVSANGLVRENGKTMDLLRSCADERPLSVQIFGSDPSLLADAAQVVAENGADIVDINFGCSVKKILKSGSGAALMRSVQLSRSILMSVRKAIDIPLTIKIRSGWDASGDQALSLARMAEDCGVDALTVHPRTATQGFRGLSDWSVIKRVKETVKIPVIGNGDISTAEDAIRMKMQTGCSGMMVGRAAIGNPFIFSEFLSIKRGEAPVLPSLKDRFELMNRYVAASVRYLGERQACFMMRSRLCWFAKGLKGATIFRNSIRSVSSEAEILSILSDYYAAICLKSEGNGDDNISHIGQLA